MKKIVLDVLNYTDTLGPYWFKNSVAEFEGELSPRFIRSAKIMGWNYTIKKPRAKKKK